jgi:putative membrane protein
MATVDAGTQLAIERTWLAHERTTMAWVRTAASLISFGFTIYKFFQLEMHGAERAHQVLIGPRGFALLMISIGLVALVMSAIQHGQAMKRMKASGGETPRSVAAVVAWLVAGLGIVAILAVGFRQ